MPMVCAEKKDVIENNIHDGFYLYSINRKARVYHLVLYNFYLKKYLFQMLILINVIFYHFLHSRFVFAFLEIIIVLRDVENFLHNAENYVS